MENTIFKVVQGLTVFTGALFALLAFMKIEGFLNWPWGWIFAPLVVPALALIIGGIIGVSLLIYITMKR